MNVSRKYNAVKVGQHVTWVGFWINALLAAGKIAAGIIGRSGAMVADGVHSLSDFITDIIVIVFVGVAHRKADANYQYGHGKYETFATMLIAMFLAFVAAAFFYDGAERVWHTLRGHQLPRPGMIALWAAIISIVLKEWLFHYTRRWGRRIHSASVVANAWHHRSDSLSSAATLVGIAGAMFLGQRWRVLDPIAAMVVSVFIFVVAWQIGMPSIKELLEVSLPKELTRKMWEVIASTQGVEGFHHFMSRRNGNASILDFHIKVNPSITVVQGHEIATAVERNLRERFGDDMIINIHVEPYKGEMVDEMKHCADKS